MRLCYCKNHGGGSHQVEGARGPGGSHQFKGVLDPEESAMHVWDWMTKKVITVGPDDYVSDAVSLIKENKIKHIPVMKGAKLKGIISDRDIKEYVPSKATSLDVYELHYLLSTTKVKTIMHKSVFTTTPDTPVEEAALALLEGGISCLPVMGVKGLAGIITVSDIFRALVDISGVRHGGHRITVLIKDSPGTIKEVTDIVRAAGFNLRSIMTSYEGVRKGARYLMVRTKGEKGSFAMMKNQLNRNYKNVEIIRG